MSVQYHEFTSAPRLKDHPDRVLSTSQISAKRHLKIYPVLTALAPLLNPLEDQILEYHAQGGSVRTCLRWLNRVIQSPIEVGITTFYMWLHSTDPRDNAGKRTGEPGPRWLLWQEARKLGAQSLVDECREIVDGIPMFAEITDVAVAKLRVEQRRWEAERMNHQEFGRQERAVGAAIVNLNILHLTAVQAANAERLPEQRHGERGITYEFTDAAAHHQALLAPPAAPPAAPPTARHGITIDPGLLE